MRRNTKGFTLTEIIVVLVIMGILLAIAVPSIIGYVQQAKDSRLLQEARNVLIVAKDNGTQLQLSNKLNDLTTDTVMKKIIKESEVEGELKEMHLNKKQDNAGNFIVEIEGKYISYDDEKHQFTFIEEYDTALTRADTVMNGLLSGDAFAIISKYYDSRTGGLDSEGGNYGKKIHDALANAGLASGDFSFRIYQGNGKYTITISERKITTDDIDSTAKVNVIQYEYPGKNFTGDPVVKSAQASVIRGNDASQGKYPVLKLDDINDWEILTK